MRRSTLLVFFATLLIGLSLFILKSRVVDLEQHHKRIQKSIHENRETLHILRAEWAHLNDPKSLQNLAQKYLDIQPVQSHQLVSFEDVASSHGKRYDRDALNLLIANVMADQNPEDQD